jgi:hypothetical protein
MDNLSKQQKVDDLIDHFWKNGFLTLSRRFGTYLPEPKQIGTYQVDAIGKQKKKYAIGIILTEEDLDNPKIFSKLDFLATRNTKYSHKRITLFIGVAKNFINKANLIVSNLSEEAQKNIKLVGISEDRLP